ncbi:hypothetical protein ACHQM5_012840 [Ranunculus cassubicifolius]
MAASDTHDNTLNRQQPDLDYIKTYVSHFYRQIREKNMCLCGQMYQGLFQKLCNVSPWPSVDAVAPHADHYFCLLYRVMWFRHLYLPNHWLWDMVDGFVCQYKEKTKNETGAGDCASACGQVLDIIQILEKEKQGLEQFTATYGYDYSGSSNVLKVLGYFSLVGLLRLHCLLGDYHTALKCLLPIDTSQSGGLYTTVIGSHITTIYYYGFANLMLRRYVEAIREFNKILTYIFKTKQFLQENSPEYDQILKKYEQMYALRALCLSLCPQGKLVAEDVNSQLREKYGEEMLKMQKYYDDAYVLYDDAFPYDAYRVQLKLFLYEVKQQQLLSSVRTFLKLHSTISFNKLATYMEVDEPTVRSILLTYERKTHSVGSDGMIHVVETKSKRYGDYVMHHIVKLEEMINDLDRAMLDR